MSRNLRDYTLTNLFKINKNLCLLFYKQSLNIKNDKIKNDKTNMPQNKTSNTKNWNEWFSGLIDADGCLLLSSNGYGSLEMTMGIFDEYPLQQIKKTLGGSIK